MTTINNIKSVVSISAICYETYPCQHTITYINNDNENITTKLNGVEIVKLRQQGKIPLTLILDKHFDEYLD